MALARDGRVRARPVGADARRDRGSPLLSAGDSEAADLSGRAVLVTGAGGFLGTHLCAALAAAGARVHGTSRSDRAPDDTVVRWWRTDLLDAEDVARIVDAVQPEQIFHLAGHVSAGIDPSLVLPTFHGLLTSTVNVLTAATRRDVGRIVLAGSVTEPEGADERAGSPYAVAKWAASGYARMFHAVYGTPVVIARTFMTYGPAQHPTKLIPYVIRTLLEGGTPRVASAHLEADWIFVRDVVRAYVRLGVAPGVEGATLDIGTGRLVAMRALVEAIRDRVAPGADVCFAERPDRPIERVDAADVETTAARIGWRPEVSLGHGLDETVAWYRQQVCCSG